MEIYKCIIIGSGPAAMTAALFLNQASVNHVMIQGDKPGGSLLQSDSVRNWPGVTEASGKTIIKSMRDQVHHGGTRIICDRVVHVDFQNYQPCFRVDTKAAGSFLALTLIIATGASPRHLNIPGETHFFGKGVYTCALCEGSVVKHSDVAIVGGGDNAVAKALYLSPLTNQVHLILRGDKFRCKDAHRLKQVLHDKKIRIFYNTRVIECLGDEDKQQKGKHLRAILLERKDGKRQELPIKAMFLAIGIIPNSSIFPVKKNSSGFIEVDKKQETSVKRVFAAGDVSDETYHQSITAASDGCKCAVGAKDCLDLFPRHVIDKLPVLLDFDKQNNKMILKPSKHHRTEDCDPDLGETPLPDVEEIQTSQDFRDNCVARIGQEPVMLEIVSANCTICSHTQLLLEDLPPQFPKVKFFRADIEMIDPSDMDDITHQLGIPKDFELPYMFFFGLKSQHTLFGLPSRQDLLVNLEKISSGAST